MTKKDVVVVDAGLGRGRVSRSALHSGMSEVSLRVSAAVLS